MTALVRLVWVAVPAGAFIALFAYAFAVPLTVPQAAVGFGPAYLVLFAPATFAYELWGRDQR